MPTQIKAFSLTAYPFPIIANRFHAVPLPFTVRHGISTAVLIGTELSRVRSEPFAAAGRVSKSARFGSCPSFAIPPQIISNSSIRLRFFEYHHGTTPLHVLTGLGLSPPSLLMAWLCPSSPRLACAMPIVADLFNASPHPVAYKLICSMPAPCVSPAYHADASRRRGSSYLSCSHPRLSKASLSESVRCVAAPHQINGYPFHAVPALIKSGLRTSYARQANCHGTQPRLSTYALALSSEGRLPSITLPSSSSSSHQAVPLPLFLHCPKP